VLKAVEDHRIRRLGGNREIPIDVRVIAATNRDLKLLVASGQFREDLLHRLDLFRVALSPLRERGDDILSLAGRMVAKLCQRHRLPIRRFTPAGKQRLLDYAWPGNVRELAHEIERAIVFEDSAELDFACLQTVGGAVGRDPKDWYNSDFRFPPEGFVLDDAILRIIQAALDQTDQNVSAAARLLGVTRDYVRYRLSGRMPPGDGGA
jgi:DNA-binding NtrC family response regulator